jgi:large subunit ribosomal protein L19
MINRRKQLMVPEFYVGSIMAVTVSDPYAPGKSNRFVGICIRRDDYGLRHNFTLRNTIDGLGVEILYDMYNPTIQSIEVLQLEKRLDDNLSYLQDCPPEYSTIPFDFQPVKLLPGMKVPINDTKVPLNKKPWRHRWDRKHLRGVKYPEQKLYEYKEYLDSHTDFQPYAKWDMMKHYREGVHDHDHTEIVQDIKNYEADIEDRREIIIASKKLVKTRRIPSERPSSENKK